jgi:hypothetical protein
MRLVVQTWVESLQTFLVSEAYVESCARNEVANVR